MLRILIRRLCPTRHTLADHCRTMGDAALVACLVLTPLALGGRHDLGRFVYVATVATAGIATIARSMLLRRSFNFPLVPACLAGAAVVVVALQITPLPRAVLTTLAPGHANLLPMWEGDVTSWTWSTISLAPAETAEGLALLLAHLVLFFVIAERARTEDDVRLMLGAVGVAAVGMMVLAILQKIAPSERLLWAYDYPSESFARHIQGTFSNRNHLAHFLLFGAAALTPFAFVDSEKERRKGSARRQSQPAWRLAAMASIIALLAVALATQSRGAAAALVIAAAVGAGFRWVGGRLSFNEVIATVAIGAVALVGVSFFGYEEVTSRLDDLVSGQVDELDAESRRRLIWGANIDALAANPWFGHGAGSHRYVYPAYLEEPSEREFTHAESGYLQIGTEFGSAGLALLAMAVALSACWLVVGIRGATGPRQVALWSALGAGMTVSVTHSVVDFVWYLPALCGLVVVFAALAMRLVELQRESSSQSSLSRPRPTTSGWLRAGSVVAACSFAVASLWAPCVGSLAWDQYLRASKTIRRLESRAIIDATALNDPYLGAQLDEVTQRAIIKLERVTQVDRLNARAHARLAGRLLQRFDNAVAESDNPMPVDMIAGAVSSGGFDSPRAVREWLLRAFGENSLLLERARGHAEAAVRLCPVQGEAYLQLASLSFLGEESSSLDALVEQAVRVRPMDGRVRFEAGRQEHLAGDVEAAFGHYRASIRMPGSHRERLVALLSRVLPAETFVSELRPDCAATDLVLAAYREVGSEADIVAIAEHAEAESSIEDQTLSDRDAARRWRQVSIVNRSIARYDKSIVCAQQAYELLPYDFWVRHELAVALFEAGRFVEADPHLRWCLARRPDIRYLQNALQEAAKQRIASGASRPPSWRLATAPEATGDEETDSAELETTRK